MNGQSGWEPERRARLVAALVRRAELLRLPEHLIATALLRCLPRGEAIKASAPSGAGPSGAIPLAEQPPTSGRLPVPTQVATALTEVGDDRPAVTPPAAVSAMPLEEERVDHGALTPRSLARLGSDSGQWDALADGTIIAGYRIESPLGSGAMGQVYRATQLSMNRAVAFKVLAPQLGASSRFRERFLREARAAGRLHHPNLIAVHDVGEADGLMFFSMELVEGTTLSELLRRHGRIPEMRALEICRQTLEALKFAHTAGVIHRDIKPDNLMVTKSGMVKVADLGLARAEDAEDASVTATNVGAIMGTPHYMAPEQGRDAHTVDHRADLYAVGATLFHLVCGHTPFAGDAAMEVLMRAASQPLRFPEPGPSPAVRVLISRLMEKEPKDRPQSAGEVIEVISKLRRQQIDEDPDSAPNAVEAVARARRRRLRRTVRRLSWFAFVLSIALVAIVVLLGLAGGWQWSRTQGEVALLMQGHRYHDAMQVLARQPQGLMAPAREVERLRTEIERAWDSWAFLQVQTTFKTMTAQLAERRLAEAYTTLQTIGEEVKSPGVRKDYDSFQNRWEEAMLADDANKVVPEGGRVRELWPQEYLNHLGADLLRLLAFTPRERVVVAENTLRFTGTGSGRGDISAALGNRILRFVVRFPDKSEDQAAAHDQLALPFADGHTLVLTRAGIVLSGGGGADRQLAAGAEQYTLSVQFTSDGVEALIPGIRGPAMVAKPSKELVLAWDVGSGRAIDLRLRVVPNERKRKP